MKILYSQTTLSKDYLKENDIIHNDSEQSFEKFVKDEPSYQIRNFITNEERIALRDFYFRTFPDDGYAINNVYSQVINPLGYPFVKEILWSKIHEELSDVVLYADVSDDKIPVGDHFFLMVNAYTVHTDSITHIPGYAPYKDLIIPLEIDQDAETTYYTCEQRFYQRATHFKRKWHTPYFANYANIVKNKPYESYGVTNTCYDKNKAIQEEWYNDKISGANIPYSVFEGLSLENEFDWIPGSAIVQDASVLHGPTDFKRKNAKWKLGITFHFLKEEPNYGYPLDGYPTKYSKYTLPFKEEESTEIPYLKLFGS